MSDDKPQPSSAEARDGDKSRPRDQHNTKRNLIGLTAASFAQVVIQFLIQVVVAYQFGAKADADALAAALVIPTILASIISGSLSYVLVPYLVACLTDGSERDGQRVAGWFGIVTAVIALITSLLVMVAAAEIVHGLYSGLPADQQTTATRLLRILSWQILMSTLVGWSLAVHHSRHSFIVPAIGGVIGTSLTLFIAAAFGKEGVHWIAIGINAGSLLSTLIHVLPILRHVSFGTAPRSHLTRLLWGMLPLVAGSLYLRIEPLVDRSLASGLDEGSVAHLHYSQRMIIALLSISTSGLSVIAFPQLAGRLASEGRDGFISHFALAARRLLIIVLPIAIGFSLFAVPVITDLLQRGVFEARDSQAVGWLIVTYMGMFIGASWNELLARGFYTLGDTRTPTIIGAMALTVALVVKWLSVPYGGIWAIAGSSALTYLLAGIGMSILLVRQTHVGIFTGCIKAAVWSSAAALAACAVCVLPYTFSFGRTWVAAPLGAIVYAMLIYPLSSGAADKQDQPRSN